MEALSGPTQGENLEIGASAEYPGQNSLSALVDTNMETVIQKILGTNEMQQMKASLTRSVDDSNAELDKFEDGTSFANVWPGQEGA